MTQYTGEASAFLTAICWTATAICFEYVARKIGSLALNILRLIMALGLFIIAGLILRGEALPLSLGPRVWFWLSLSGFVGFFIADLFFFQAYVDIGARLTQVITVCSPISTAILGFLVFGERLTRRGLLGIALVLGSIIFVLTAGSPAPAPAGAPAATSGPGSPAPPGGLSGGPQPHRRRGILFAVLAGLGQSAGLILSKIGAPDSDPLAATQVRIMAGLAGFFLFLGLTGRLKKSLTAVKDRRTFGMLALGTVAGPFLGVTFSLLAMQKTNSGTAATLMNLVPIMILLPEFLIYKRRVTFRELAGAVGAVLGAALIFL